MNTHIKTWLGTTIIIIIVITAGMFVWKVYDKNTVYAPAPQTIQTPKPKVNENNVGMANPASVFCEENGGKLEIITATDGSQIGMCKFSDGSECEEWAFQRGECKQSDSLNQIDTSDWKTYRNEKYGFEFKYPNNLFFLDPQGAGVVPAEEKNRFLNSPTIIVGSGADNPVITINSGKENKVASEEIIKNLSFDSDILINGVVFKKYKMKNGIYNGIDTACIFESAEKFNVVTFVESSLSDQILSTFKFIN